MKKFKQFLLLEKKKKVRAVSFKLPFVNPKGHIGAGELDIQSALRDYLEKKFGFAVGFDYNFVGGKDKLRVHRIENLTKPITDFLQDIKAIKKVLRLKEETASGDVATHHDPKAKCPAPNNCKSLKDSDLTCKTGCEKISIGKDGPCPFVCEKRAKTCPCYK